VTWPAKGKNDASQEVAAADMYRVNAVTGQVYDSAGHLLKTN
jgi:hypothetical protein